jgi:hypothetical protein
MRWLEEHPEFRTSYARARERLVEFWADEIIEIANDTERDFVDGKVDPRSASQTYCPRWSQIYSRQY